MISQNLRYMMLILLISLSNQVAVNAGVPGEAKNYDGMPYRLFIPENYDAEQDYPLVLCFHGAGGRGDNNAGNVHGNQGYKRLAKDDVQSSHPCFLVAPQCPNGKRWVGNEDLYKMKNFPMTEDMTTAFEILDLVRDKYSIDEERIYVTGQSMGGHATWYAVASRPELFAAAVPIAAEGPPGQAENLKDISFWVFHGAKDPTVPVDRARKMVEACRRAGVEIKYTEYPDVKHFSWNPAWKEDRIVPWLFRQEKDEDGQE